MNCFNQGCQCQSGGCGQPTCGCRPTCSCGMGGAFNAGGCGCGSSCGCGPCGCPRPQPVVMPTQVCVQRRMVPQEQPVIVPIERRTINQCCYFPRFYPVVQNTSYTQFN
ncbi:MAG: hypothetical protein ACLRVU_03280 [Beduini sp.]|uniref:hypothetical protein n=1 Tax=Beduini sp. TaxID=1922300 RepID=UPI0039A2378A